MPLDHDPADLRNYFANVTGKDVSLTVTDNSTTMLSVREKRGAVSLRLHRIFLTAGKDVLQEIAQFVKHRRGKTPLLRKFVRQNNSRVKKRTHRKLTIKTRGRHYDLAEIFESLNDEYFGGRISSLITWGNKNPGYGVKKRTLGSYGRHADIIRINSILDRKAVPGYFVAFVVYHEMLHADMDVEKKDGRRSLHSREFKEREKLFGQYEKAIGWEKQRLRLT